MVRLVVTAFAGLLCGIASGQEPHVNLNHPGALDRLERSNPQHYRKIVQILDRVHKAPQSGPAYWLPASVNASRVQYFDGLMMASLPPKQDLRFTLDNVNYALRIVRFDLGRAHRVR